MSGQVLVNDQPVTKQGQAVDENAAIRIRGEGCPYVSRGGLKLKGAIDSFKVDVKNKIALDVGASTGGFTDVLLQEGAVKVFAVDVGHNQLDWKIRKDARVIVIEKLNARNIEFNTIGQTVDIIVVDVSFISLQKVLPALLKFSGPNTDWITLIKPQFEAGREKVGKGGIVRSESDRIEVVERIKEVGESLGLARQALVESSIAGTDGNKEYLAHWKPGKIK